MEQWPLKPCSQNMSKSDGKIHCFPGDYPSCPCLSQRYVRILLYRHFRSWNPFAGNLLIKKNNSALKKNMYKHILMDYVVNLTFKHSPPFHFTNHMFYCFS